MMLLAAPLPRILWAVAYLGAASARPGPLPPLQALLDRGDTVVAEGALVQDPGSACLGPDDGGRSPLIQDLVLRGCLVVPPVLGRFKRLEGRDGAFVCVSFRAWTCYPSDPAP